MIGVKIVLAPVGTRGDVQPMLALGLALRARGHQAVVCAPDNYGAWARSLGFEFLSCGPDFAETLGGDAHRDQGTATILRLRKQIRAQFDALEAASAGASAIVGAMLQFAGPSIAEKRGLPYFYAVFWPILLRSPGHPIIGAPFASVPRWVS